MLEHPLLIFWWSPRPYPVNLDPKEVHSSHQPDSCIVVMETIDPEDTKALYIPRRCWESYETAGSKLLPA